MAEIGYRLGPIISRIKEFKRVIEQHAIARSRPVLLTVRVVRDLNRDDASHLAAGVAYYSIFSLFPLLLGLLAIMGMVLNSESMEQKFLAFITENLPGSGEFVGRNVEAIIRIRGALGILAILGLLWSASAVFGAISRAVNRAWDIHQDRPFYIAKPRQLLMALAVGVLFLLSMLVNTVIQLLAGDSSGFPGQLVLGHYLYRFFPCLVTLAIFLMIYRFVPNRRTYWRYTWPGAMVAALLFEVGKSLFLWYLGSFAAFNQVYGNVASVIVLLLWAYLSSFVLILGAEISSECEKIYGHEPEVQDRVSH